MKMVFLETNVINTCLKENISGEELLKILSEKKWTPVISQHTTYEIARTFNHDAKQAVGKKLLDIIKELNPIFGCQTQTLLDREVKKLLYGSSVNFFIEEEYNISLQNAISDLCSERKIHDYTKFIKEREEKIYDTNMWGDFLDENKTLDYRNISFIDFRNLFLEKKMYDRVGDFVSIYALPLESIELLIYNLDSYPALRALIFSQLYLNYIAIKGKNSPAKDKNDDLRHLIDSAYCSIFVTDDNKLLKYANEINPDIQLIRFSEMLSSKET